MNPVRGKWDPSFCLHFEEGFYDEADRHCTPIKEVLFGDGGITGLLVEIDPPCSGELYTSREREIRVLLLSPLFWGQSFCPVERWPMPVHIYIPLVENPELRDHIKVAETNNIALGAILQTPPK